MRAYITNDQDVIPVAPILVKIEFRKKLENACASSILQTHMDLKWWWLMHITYKIIH